MIADYLTKYKTPCTTIAYGAEIVSTSDTELLKTESLPTENFVLHIGRVQPDNHVKEILESAKESGKTLVAVGDYSTTMERNSPESISVRISILSRTS